MAGYSIAFSSDSSLTHGLHVFAAVGGGAPHRFEIDTGSVGILVPRSRLGPQYQLFDPAQDIDFGYISSGKTYSGQWVKVAVAFGVPPDWDATGDYPLARVDVFAVDQPTDFDGGMMGIGFAIGGQADGGPARNPLTNIAYPGGKLAQGYIVDAGGMQVGLSSLDTAGFAFVALKRDASGSDWAQPMGSLSLPGGFDIRLPVLVDTGVDGMLIFVEPHDRPAGFANGSLLPAGTAVGVCVPPDGTVAKPALQYAFVTGAPDTPTAPSSVQWRDGHGLNTGRNVLAGFDYLFDATGGRIGFRPRAQVSKLATRHPLASPGSDVETST